MKSYHEPVMLSEVCRFLDIQKGKRYIDATLGGAGYTERMLESGAFVLGIDADIEAIEHAKDLVRKYGQNVSLVHSNYRNIDTISRSQGFSPCDGIVFDLGVSSHQLDSDNRGFSWRNERAGLDARFDQTQGETAEKILNTLSKEELYEIFTTYGEEEHSRAIVDAIASARSIEAITTVGTLRRCIDVSIPSYEKKESVYSRIFMAIRIAVNDELRSLRIAVSKVGDLLVPGGRVVVVSFHSLEDRIVKLTLRRGGFMDLTGKPVCPTQQEMKMNSRARSAKLRAAQKIV